MLSNKWNRWFGTYISKTFLNMEVSNKWINERDEIRKIYLK